MSDRTFVEIAQELNFQGRCIALLSDDADNWCVTDEGISTTDYPMEFIHKCPSAWFEDSIDEAIKNFLKREKLSLEEIFGE